MAALLLNMTYFCTSLYFKGVGDITYPLARFNAKSICRSFTSPRNGNSLVPVELNLIQIKKASFTHYLTPYSNFLAFPLLFPFHNASGSFPFELVRLHWAGRFSHGEPLIDN